MKNLLSASFLLTAENIDDASLKLQTTLKEAAVSKEYLLHTRLKVEDLLFCWLGAGKVNHPVSIQLQQNFNKLRCCITMKGEECNPWQQEDNLLAGGELVTYLKSITDQADFSYKQGKNIITMIVPNHRLSSVFKIIAMIVLAFFTSLIIKSLLPDSVSFIAHHIFEPLYQKGLGLLAAVAIPVIFCSLLTGIVSIGSPQQLNKHGRKLLRCFVETKFLAMVTFVIIILLTRPLSYEGNIGISHLFISLGTLFLSFIPTNLFTPFTTGNTMQIVVLAAVFGIAILYMRETMDIVVEILYSMSKLINSLLQVICSFVPLLIFLGLTKTLLINDISVMTHALKMILYVIASLAAAALVLTVYAKFKLKFRLPVLLKKIRQPLLIGFASASSMVAYNSIMTTCKKELGIKPEFANFAVPLGQTLMTTGDAAAIIILTVFGLNMNQIPVNVPMIITLGITVFIVSYGLVGTTGGSIPVLTMLFASWHIPNDCLVLILTAYVFTDFFNTILNIFSNVIAILLASKATGNLDCKKLL